MMAGKVVGLGFEIISKLDSFFYKEALSRITFFKVLGLLLITILESTTPT